MNDYIKKETGEQFKARCINNGLCPECLEKLEEKISPCGSEYELICVNCDLIVDHDII